MVECMNHTWISMYWNSVMNIRLLCLPSHCTHIVQPHDVFVFGPYQHRYSQEVDAACRLGKTGIGKHNFFDFLVPARTKTFHTQGLIKEAFQTTGIHPYNPKAVYLLLHHLNLQQSPINSEIHTTASYSFSILQFPMTTMTVLLSINSSVLSFKLQSGLQQTSPLLK